MTPAGTLVDAAGRRLTYLRVSITDRCNLRCAYCMPAEGVPSVGHDRILRYEEIRLLVALLVDLGIRRVRITGGEPLVRKGVEGLVRDLAALPGVEEVTLTTNGQRLEGMAAALRDAGLARMNVSLDTLDPDRYRLLTRVGELAPVLQGVEAARGAGLRPVKLNMVVLPDTPLDDARALVDWCARHPGELEPRFIEHMPFRGPGATGFAELRRVLVEERGLVPDRTRGPGPAVVHRDPATGLRVGFIAPLTGRFCGTCNRLRLTAEGQLRPCLSREEGPSLRDLLRADAGRDALVVAIRDAVTRRPEGHCHLPGGEGGFHGCMSAVGG